MLAITFLCHLQQLTKLILRLEEMFVCLPLPKMASLVGMGARQWPGVERH